MLARVRSTGKRIEDRIAALIQELRSQDQGQPRYLTEPVNETDDELVEEVRKRMRQAGCVPKLKKKKK